MEPDERAAQTTEEWAASLSEHDCEVLIEKTMAAHDFKGVVAALDLLRRKNPARADEVLTVIKAGMSIAVERAAGEASRG